MCYVGIRLDIAELSELIHEIIRKCASITRRARATCTKLKMHTIRRKVRLGKLPTDPESLISLALHTVPDTYLVDSDITLGGIV